MPLIRVAYALALITCLLCNSIVRAEEDRCSFDNQRVECGKLSCDQVTGQCVPCTNSSQCHEAVMRCSIEGECDVGSVADTFSAETLMALMVTMLVCAIAVVAGLGGGGILVPMYAALTEMPLISAVGLSQAAICGQSAFNMIYQIPKTMPTQTPNEVRPLINYQYLAILLPLSLIGTLLGSLGGRVVPDWLRLALLFLLLTSVLHRVIEKAKRQYKQDAAEKNEEAAALTKKVVQKPQQQTDANATDTGAVSMKPVLSTTPAAPRGQTTTTVVVAEEAVGSEGESHFDDNDGPRSPPSLRMPRREISLMGFSFLVLLISNIVRSNFTVCGSTAHVLLFIIPIVVLAGLWWLAKHMAAVTLANVASGFLSPDHMTFQWNQKTMIYFPVAAVVAGAGAALLGIGGGLVLSFVLFEAGLAPEEASATSGFATLLIASEAALLMLFQGQLVPDYATMYFVCGVVSTVLGQSGFMAYIRWSKKRFLIVTALACIIGGSLLMLTSYGLYEVVEQYKRHDGSLLRFGHICNRL
uniref:Sulfite exporter TauE/SafE n=1 Tax=Bodo saltans TaxID=75058 RepID=B6DT85_BODSA|nr:hypothetical protein [Bodo saltans]